ncbi:MAG: hypothetical protein J3K34DRAFT_486209 [Monoraphidium minutum]|nr:MAG: hypothetical protein J3K34DRAFT_486209 [Monoraphidium minutum]
MRDIVRLRLAAALLVLLAAESWGQGTCRWTAGRCVAAATASSGTQAARAPARRDAPPPADVCSQLTAGDAYLASAAPRRATAAAAFGRPGSRHGGAAAPLAGGPPGALWAVSAAVAAAPPAPPATRPPGLLGGAPFGGPGTLVGDSPTGSTSSADFGGLADFGVGAAPGFPTARVLVRAPPPPPHFAPAPIAPPPRAARGAAVAALLAAGPSALGRCGELGAVEALLDHFGSLGQDPGAAWWGAIERESRSLLRGAGPEAAAALLAAVARAGRRPSGAWLAAAQEELTSAARRAAAAPAGAPAPGAEAWAAALAALARVGAADARTAAALLAAAGAALPAAPAAALPQLLGAAAKARVDPGAPLLGRVRAALSHRAGELSSSQLAKCIKYLALIAEHAEAEGQLREAAGQLAAELAARPGGAGPGELAQSLWALARLGHRAAPGQLCPVDALLPVILEQLPRLSPAQLSGLLWALAKLGARPPPAAAALLGLEAAAQMPGMSNKEFTQAAWALAKLPPGGRGGPPPPRALVERLWQQAEARGPGLSAAESGLLLFAAARLGLEPPPRWLSSALAAARAALPGLRPEQLVSTLVSLARLQRAPPAEWMASFEAAAALRAFSLQELVNTLWAMRSLGHAPSLRWQHAAATALRAACGAACGLPGPLGAAAAGDLLEQAGLLPVLAEAIAQQTATDGCGGDGGGAEGGLECPISLGAFELPLGAA